MEALKTLFLIDLIILGVNAIVIGLLWKTTKIIHYRKLLFIWASGFGSLLLSAAFQSDSQLLNGLLFSTNFLVYFLLAEFFSVICGFSFSWKKKVLNYFLLIGLATFLLSTHLITNRVYWFLIGLATALPSLQLGVEGIRKYSQLKSLIIRLGIFNGFASALSTMTYWIYYDRPEILQAAYIVALIYVVANTLLLPGIVVQKSVEEKFQLEFELKNRTREAYQSKMISLGQISAGVAHEINNPLFAIQLSINKFERNRENTDTFLSQLKTQIGQLSGSISNFNKFSGFATVSEETTELQSALDGILMFYREKARKLCVELTFENLVGPRDIPINYFELVQILDILLDNAFEAAAETDERWVKILVKDENKQTVIEVQNGGPPLTPDIVRDMWKLFFTTKEGKSGVGLGIAKGISDKNKGNLTFDQSSGHPTFRFVI